VPTPALSAALFSRFYSREDGDYAARVLAALRNQFGGHAVKKAGTYVAESSRQPARRGARAPARPPTNLVIFGATGDLARRKLLPAVYNLAHEGALPERFNLIGVSRGEMSDDEYRERRAESIRAFSRTRPTRTCSTDCSPSCATSPGLRRRRHLQPSSAGARELDEAAGEPMSRAFYLSTAPEFFP
jgi:hypothetical protein